MEYFETENTGGEQENVAPVQNPEIPEEIPVETGSWTAPPGAPETGKKVSPFADSPYVMNHDARPQAAAPGYTAAQFPPKAEKMPARGGKVWKRILCAVLIIGLVAGSCGITAAQINRRWEEETRTMTQDFQLKLDDLQQQVDKAAAAAKNNGNSVSGTVSSGDGLTPGQVYAQNVDSVVLITCKVAGSAYGQSVTGTSAGSGFILTENGYVVTNAHVVEGAAEVTVATHEGEELPAQIIGSDSINDVAVLKVEANGLPAVTLGSSDALIVGDQVVAIGNPLGELTSTMTAGYVSAKNRDVNTDGVTINMIQTDAAINSGNSGGPLFNMKGQVVGITTAKYSGSSASGASIEGIGFAIPIDDVIGMVEDLINYGYVTGAYLGVMVSDVDAAAAEYYGIPMGAYVREVTPGYCAEAAGLQEKDIIIALGGYGVTNVSTLTRALRNFKAGDTTTLTVSRGGKTVVLDITLDEKPATTETPAPQPNEGDMPKDGSYQEWYDYFFPFD